MKHQLINKSNGILTCTLNGLVSYHLHQNNLLQRHIVAMCQLSVDNLKINIDYN